MTPRRIVMGVITVSLAAAVLVWAAYFAVPETPRQSFDRFRRDLAAGDWPAVRARLAEEAGRSTRIRLAVQNGSWYNELTKYDVLRVVREKERAEIYLTRTGDGKSRFFAESMTVMLRRRNGDWRIVPPMPDSR